MKDKARPFVVSAGAVQVEAVGTAFSVRRCDGGADVMVTEGTVRVWVEGRKAEAISLSGGSSAFVTGAAQVQPGAPAAPTIERKLAWRAGKMSLDGETLGEAAAEFNRYSPTQILIRDPDVAQKRLYGSFRLDDPEGFARTAAITLGVAAWSEDQHIVIAKTRR
ncbi:FecR family protein [Sphingopyxis sp. R3-92]|uniref:FecR family protein n=1 Tax=Sphingopyxis sp. R3-92 TaxID=3158553 RepID=UPI003EE80EB1